MGRRTRSYLPGTVFHLTARTSGRERWFDAGLRDHILAFIAMAQTRTDALLLAYALMDNHFHLIVRQGKAPLAKLIQPICRRTALAVNRTWGREGHVFERRFRDRPCHDADHVRAAIVYTHLNPCRAKLCDDPTKYRWSSHAIYSGTAPATAGAALPRITACIELFGSEAYGNSILFHRDYQRHVEWRQAVDRLPEGAPRWAQPAVSHGDAYWRQYFAAPAASAGAPAPARALDLRDLARVALRDIDPRLNLDFLYGRKGGQVAAVRRRIIVRALEAGFRGVQIARFLGVSESTISAVATAAADRSVVMIPGVRSPA